MTNPINPTGLFTTTSSNEAWWSEQLQAFTPVSGSASFGSQPQPAPVSPQPSSGWTMRPPGYYFQDDGSACNDFNDRRNALIHINSHSGVQPVWTEEHELKLVDKVWRHHYDEPWPGTHEWSHEPLNLDALPTLSLRKHKLQPFKINYETYQEIKLRLYNTVISIKGHPFWVKAVGAEPDGFKLAVTDGTKMYQVKYNDLTDLRSIPSIYTTHPSAGWLGRHPGRVYQQGMNRSNTSIFSIDGRTRVYNFDPQGFVTSFRKREDRKWQPVFSNLMANGELPSIRLSDEVAVTQSQGKIVACYKGRTLGNVEDNAITLFDEDDALQGWIEAAAKKVNMELRVA